MRCFIWSFSVCEKVEGKGRTTYNEVFIFCFFQCRNLSCFSIIYIQVYIHIFKKVTQISEPLLCNVLHTESVIQHNNLYLWMDYGSSLYYGLALACSPKSIGFNCHCILLPPFGFIGPLHI